MKPPTLTSPAEPSSGLAAEVGGSGLDAVQGRLALLEEFLAWRNLLLDRYAGAEGAAELSEPLPESRDAAPNDEATKDDEELLRILQRALLRHPAALQEGFSALVREGRRFAETEEGSLWRERLEGSEMLEKVRMLWEATSLTVVSEEDSVLPSALLEVFVRSASGPDLETIATRIGLPFLGSAEAEFGPENEGSE